MRGPVLSVQPQFTCRRGRADQPSICKQEPQTRATPTWASKERRRLNGTPSPPHPVEGVSKSGIEARRRVSPTNTRNSRTGNSTNRNSRRRKHKCLYQATALEVTVTETAAACRDPVASETAVAHREPMASETATAKAVTSKIPAMASTTAMASATAVASTSRSQGRSWRMRDGCLRSPEKK